MHILLIESDHTLQHLFAKGLVTRGLTVDAADSAHSGMMALLDNLICYDAVVWDIDKPDAFHQALMDTLQDSRRRHIPLIVMSDKAYSRRAFATLSRATHVLLKPLSIRGLAALVASLQLMTVN